MAVALLVTRDLSVEPLRSLRAIVLKGNLSPAVADLWDKPQYTDHGRDFRQVVIK